MGIIVGKAEARACIFIFVVRFNAVTQTARLAHYRKCSVSHGYHLAETARLKKRRHQKCVACSVNAVA